MVGSFYCFSDLITMVLRSYISIEISARTDATSVRCRSRMWQRQSHLTEANALVLYFCTSIQKDISCPMSSTPPRVARSFLERTMKWYLRRDLYTLARIARRVQFLVHSFFAAVVTMQSFQSKRVIQGKSGNILRGPTGQNLDDLDETEDISYLFYVYTLM